jgi:hypothetical protein
MRSISNLAVLLLALAGLLLAGCSAGDPAPVAAPGPPAVTQQRFPDIVDVKVTPIDGRFTFAVTVSSPYDTPERYADAFRVRSASGEVYGVNELAHDHASEQPFTRSLTVQIPTGVDQVVVEGRDQHNGWGGHTRTVTLPR